jgi:hypothetical protein
MDIEPIIAEAKKVLGATTTIVDYADTSGKVRVFTPSGVLTLDLAGFNDPVLALILLLDKEKAEQYAKSKEKAADARAKADALKSQAAALIAEAEKLTA